MSSNESPFAKYPAFQPMFEPAEDISVPVCLTLLNLGSGSGSSRFASSDSAGKSGLTCETSLYSSRAIMYMRLSSPYTVTL